VEGNTESLGGDVAPLPLVVVCMLLVPDPEFVEVNGREGARELGRVRSPYMVQPLLLSLLYPPGDGGDELVLRLNHHLG